MAEFNFETKKPNKKEKVLKDSRKFIVGRLGILGVAVVSVVWLFWGFFTPVLKDTSIWILILSGGVSMVVAYSIGALLRYQGILSGSVDSEVVQLKKEHREVVTAANEYAEYSDEWSEEENSTAMRLARTHILMSAGLKYSKYFDSEGNYTNEEIPTISKNAQKWQKDRYNNKNKKLKEAISFKITPVTMPAVSAEEHVDLDYNNTGLSPTEHLIISNRKALAQKVLTVAIFATIGLSIGSGAFWESLFNGLVQLVVFLLFGLIGFYSEYIYMTSTYTGNLRKKINLLKRLVVFGEKQIELEQTKKQEVIQNGNERYNNVTEETSRPSETIQRTAGTDGLQSGDTWVAGTTETTTSEHATEPKSTIGTIVSS